MDKPTQEQIKEFWEWYAAETPFENCETTCAYCRHWACPDIDLNNLFKHAVPFLKANYTLQHIDYDMIRNQVTVWYWIRRRPEKPGEFTAKCGINEDPALALFWALWQVKESNGHR